MKLQYGQTHVKGTGGITEQTNFTIRSTAQAFQILSSGLYKDKIGAVIREIACNAYDAHVAAGTPQLPIEVKIPNALDNQFHVKDWGPGMTHEEIMTLYSSYFGSTKSDSNDYTGAFGLGSKSPFSYTDSFFVTSVTDKKRVYSAFIDNKGQPTIALMAEEEPDADWKHGVMVGLPVKPSDYAQFQQKAYSILQWFKTIPKVEGMLPVRPVEYTYDSPTWARTGGTANGVIMGNVWYPLSIDQIANRTPMAEWTKHIPNLQLRVNVGDVNVTAGREELQYDVPTQKFLMNRLEEVAEEIYKEGAAAYDNLKTNVWKDLCANEVISGSWGFQPSWNLLFLAKGDVARSKKIEELTRHIIPVPSWLGNDGMVRILRPGHARPSQTIVRQGGMTGGTSNKSAYQANLYKNADTRVYYGKVEHALTRVREVVMGGAVKQAIYIAPDAATKDTRRVATRLTTHFGMEAPIDVATLPAPVVVKTAAGGVKVKHKKVTAATPVPAVTVGAWGGPHAYGRQSFSMNKIHFPSAGMMNGTQRVFRNMKTQKEYEARDFVQTWRQYYVLLRELKLPAPWMIELTQAEIKRYCMEDRGVPYMDTMMVDMLNSKPFEQAFAAEIASWKPTIQMVGWNRTWVAQLCCLLDNPNGDRLAAPVLKKTGFYNELKDLATRSSATKSTASTATPQEPEVIGLYTALTRVLPGITPIKVNRTFLTTADLETELTNKYPVLNVADSYTLRDVFSKQPAKLADFLTFLFT